MNLRILAVLALLLSLCMPAAAGDETAPGAGQLKGLARAGEKAAGFTLKDLDGAPVSYRPEEGGPSLLVFFSVYCPLCRELMPEINAVAGRHGSGIRVVGIDLDGKRFASAVRLFAKENGLLFPVLLDEIRDDLFIASDAYGVLKTPTLVFVDGSGTVRAVAGGDAARPFLRDFDRLTQEGVGGGSK